MVRNTDDSAMSQGQTTTAELAFDYSVLQAEKGDTVAQVVREHAVCIQESMKRTVAEVLDIGRRLTEVKELLEHGQFLAWIDIEFEMSTER